MFLYRADLVFVFMKSVPHGRGDEPAQLSAEQERYTCSPRAWG